MDNNNTKVMVYDNGYKCDPFAQLANQHTLNAVQMTDKDIKDSEANIRYGIKDSEAEIRADVNKAEANVRHDVLFEGQENQKTSLEVEARLKDRLSIDRNAVDAQFLALNNRLCENEKEVIKQGYEGRLETIRESDKTREKITHFSERLTDKVAHALEEIREDLVENAKDSESCCCDLRQMLVQLGASPTSMK